ncbi:hypothetical protein ACOSP7_015686 [Xanthoceras sorbifolium]
MADEYCNTRLGLGLGFGEYAARSERAKAIMDDCNLDFSFTVCTKEESLDHDHFKCNQQIRMMMVEDHGDYVHNKMCDYSNNNKNINGGRKKLRLTKHQSTLLEDTFKMHTTLNQSKKQALAEELNLKPRQVEVWFQNRRARTKLKQTEVDCEFLKKCCESLSDENKRLKKQVEELIQSSKGGEGGGEGGGGGGSPLFIQLPVMAAAAMCPSCCDKIMKTYK